MSVYQGDFLGFKLGDDHSYNLNITRISTNDRYQDNLLPTFTDATVQVPGGDGTYYWDTYYTQKNFTIDFAFDDLRDEDLRKLRQMLSYKGIKPIIFDEFPYKKYMVKCAQPPQLKYLCFDHMEFRVYKGEGQVQLVAYYPFAFGVEKAIISRKKTAVINNIGDLPANLEFIYDFTELTKNTNTEETESNSNSVSITLKETKEATSETLGYLELTGIEQETGDTYLLINFQTQLIEGLDGNKHKTGKLYNRYITAGDFFRPPVGRTYITSTKQFERVSYIPMFY